MRRLALAVALAAGAGSAAGAELRAEVDARRIGVEDLLQLTVTLSGSATALSTEVPLPELHGLAVAGGPSLSTQMSVVNGRVSQSKGVTWVLRPTATGTARIGRLELSLDGQSQATDPIQVEVVDGSVRPERPARRARDPFGDFFGSPFRDRQRRDPKLEMRAIPDRQRVHVGEPILLTYWLYTQAGVSDFGLVDAPQYPGFWVEELESPRGSIRGEETTLEGEPASRFPVVRRLLFPTRAGELTLPEARFRIGLASQGFFPDRAVVERSVAPLTIQVQALPQAPDFTGAVGSFRASTSIDRTRLPLGEAATLRFRVEGSGNLKWLEPPPHFEVPGARLYPPQVTSDVKLSPRGAEGSKTWEFVVVPETAGALEIPPIAFAWFDPVAGALRRSETAPIPLDVSGGSGAPAPALGALPSGAERGLPLRAELDADRVGNGLSPRLLLAGLALGLVLHAGIWLAPRLAESRRRAGSGRHSSGGLKTALAELARVDRGDLSKEAAAGAIAKALHEVFGSLDAQHDPDPGQRAARELLEQVQFIRYAPQLGDYSEPLRELAAKARELVKRA